MRIAIPYYEGLIFQHFGRAQRFKVYEIENRQILMEMVVENEQSGHEAVAEFLKSMDVRVVLCGNIGVHAMNALHHAGILFYAGVTGSADDAIETLVAGRLAYDPTIQYDPARDEEYACASCGDCGGEDCASCQTRGV